jgi:cytochrome c553
VSLSRLAAKCAVSFGALLLWAGAAPAQHTAPDTMAQRMLACAGCHGKEGRATNQGYFPRIAGKPAGYLYNQLVNFREGRRGYPPMAYLVEHLSDDYLREIAVYFASLDLPYPPPQTRGANAALLKRGEQLARRGDATRGVPACISCHGDALTGAAPAFPGLLGLPRDYVVSQFGSWRTGQRKARAPDCMATITERLAGSDIEAVSTWLSSQPLPPSTKPAAAVPLPLPLDCGSGLR